MNINLNCCYSLAYFTANFLYSLTEITSRLIEDQVYLELRFEHFH